MASDSWFRFYNTAPDNPKVLMLSDAQFRAWVILLSLASKLGGAIPDSVDLIAKSIRKTAQKAADTLQVLLSAGLIDKIETGYEPHNWNDRQFKSDVSTDRVKRFRNAKRNGIETDHKQSQRHKQKEEKAARMARFEEFWNSCPKKTGKGEAEKAWIKALDIAEADAIIAGIHGYSALCRNTESKFIKTPAPWLNGKHWLDEGLVPADPPPTPEQIEINKDRADRLRGRGKYADHMQ